MSELNDDVQSAQEAAIEAAAASCPVEVIKFEKA
jgi:ferredoxin